MRGSREGKRWRDRQKREGKRDKNKREANAKREKQARLSKSKTDRQADTPDTLSATSQQTHEHTGKQRREWHPINCSRPSVYRGQIMLLSSYTININSLC